MIKWIVLATLFYCSCSKKGNDYSTIICNADRLQIIKNNGNFDTGILLKKSTLEAFKDVFNNDEKGCLCESTGYVIFYLKDSLLLKVECSPYDGKCEYLIIGSGKNKSCYRFNYEQECYYQKCKFYV